MKKIDLENHYCDQIALDALARRKDYPFYDPATGVIHWTKAVSANMSKILPLLKEKGDERIALMDRLGIDTAVLSSLQGPEQLDPDESVKVCREMNDIIYEATQKYSGRFLGTATLPVGNVPAAIEEFERCVKELKFVGWLTNSNYGKSWPDEEKYRPIFKKAAELGAFVYLHPQLPENSSLEGYGFGLAGPGLGFTTDTVTTITRIILSGLFDEYPDLKVVLGHLGETIPFVLTRMENRFAFFHDDHMKNKHPLGYYYKNNIWVTTSGNMSPEAFKCCMDVFGIDHIMLGTDYPFEKPDDMLSFVENLPLNEEQRNMLFWKNATDYLGVKV